ncbi:flagellar protein FlaG [Pseudomonas panipatensis]|uniref:Flagellar protein FlaG n=1 Tax=Pseudomonas panipatensis TaxID=428992 RepID=A0A1G8C484_9PSED|nr:flagellar protein FlaG [Pseudomonas panipatensis]SDH39770.1 flagellar protein FlaG [Pseudomonas panipatensis]SMP66390.1 flagellar protein FlaG [Pseudomonas panipatensis]
MDSKLVIATFQGGGATTSGLPASRQIPADGSGKDLPQSAKDTSAKQLQDLGAAVRSLQDHAQSVQRNLEFSVDQGSGETVVKVVAADTGEVIRQIPSEVALKLAESLKESGNLLFSERA